MDKVIIIVLILFGIISLINVIAILLNKFYVKEVDIEMFDDCDLALRFVLLEEHMKFGDIPNGQCFLGSNEFSLDDLYMKLPKPLCIEIEKEDGEKMFCNTISLLTHNLYKYADDSTILPVDLA